MKRITRWFVSASLALAAVSASAQNVPLRLAVDTAAGGSFQFRIAKENGLFARQGIDASLFNFAYGIDTVNALLIDRADTALAADYALINSLGKGDNVVVSVLTRTTPKSAENTLLFVRNDIQKPADLVGRKLGVARGTVYEYVWFKYLETHGVDPKKVTFVPYSSLDEAAVSLKKGDMDAVWLGGGQTARFKTFTEVKVLGNVSTSGTNISSYLLLKRSFVEANPDVVSRLLLALQQAIDYIPGHKDETAELAFRELKLPKEGVLKELEGFNLTLGFTQEDYKHLQSLKAWTEQQGILKSNYDLKDKINVAPLRKALPKLVNFELPRG